VSRRTDRVVPSVTSTPRAADPPQTAPSPAAGLLLGLGLGGFVDGIVLHQILQWHHLVSDVAGYPVDTVNGLQLNTVADGVFHAGTWLLVVAGVVAAVRDWRRGRRALVAFGRRLLLLGWGLFDVVEGLLDHQLLGIHHVRDDLGGPLSWDLGFLAFGVLLVASGWALHRSDGPGSNHSRLGPWTRG